MDSIEARIKRAMTAEKEGLRALLKDPSDKVLIALLANRNIAEEELMVLARRRNISGEVLSCIAGMKATAKEYRLAAAIANNPRTPRRVALGLLRRLRLRDLAFITQNKMLPTELRQVAESLLKEKMPTLPLGVRIPIARMVSEEVLKTLLLDETPQQLKACFENPRMKEAVVLWAVNHNTVPAGVIRHISEHPKWSAYYSVRFALLRNPHTPPDKANLFVYGLKSMDQRYLFNDPSVNVEVKARIAAELEKKGQPLSPPKDEGRTVGIPEDLDIYEIE